VAQVALAWLLANPIVTSPIIGATSMEQLDENLGVLDLKLTDEEKNALDELTKWEER
jgi:aryl-alcohol dehydrogenase-like predicted oxidoreductase